MSSMRVFVVDDSPFVCRLLTSYLRSTPLFEVVGTAQTGVQGLMMIKELRPDVITLDIEMPGMNGLSVLERIMHECPTPVVVISGVSRQAADVTLQALNLGAVDFILKYSPGFDCDPGALSTDIIRKVHAAGEVRLIRLLSGRGDESVSLVFPNPIFKVKHRQGNGSDFINKASAPSPGVVVIGAATGGPLALCELLNNLSPDFPDAVVIIQHMPADFTRVLAAQLSRYTNRDVREAQDGDPLEAGPIFVAPGDFHLIIDADYRVRINREPKVNGNRPSIDLTMQSAAEVYGSTANGVLLTGIGDDGSLGLGFIREKGGKTYVQDAESSVINEMPQRAVERGVVDYIAPPWQIAKLLVVEHERGLSRGRALGAERLRE